MLTCAINGKNHDVKMCVVHLISLKAAVLGWGSRPRLPRTTTGTALSRWHLGSYLASELYLSIIADLWRNSYYDIDDDDADDVI